jgi:hypothetical protein
MLENMIDQNSELSSFVFKKEVYTNKRYDYYDPAYSLEREKSTSPRKTTLALFDFRAHPGVVGGHGIVRLLPSLFVRHKFGRTTTRTGRCEVRVSQIRTKNIVAR